MAIDLYLIDEVNVRFEGLSDSEIAHVIKKTERSVPGAYQSAAFKLNKWNGKESQFSPSGITFEYMLDDVLDILEKDLLIDLDADITLYDERKSLLIPDDIPEIDNQYLSHMGITLHEHQVYAVNSVLTERKGIINVATSGGKTYICVCLSKVFDPYIGSVVIVPNTELLNQTYKDYVEDGTLSVAMLKSGQSRAQKEATIANHDHIIVTWQLLKNHADLFEGFQGMVIQDETHIMGEVMMENLRFTFADCPVRVGMTASLPKSAYKRELISCHIGGHVLATVETKELQDKNIVSTCDIYMVATHHPQILHDGLKDWDTEKKYLHKNKTRAKAIADYIDNLGWTNTLILTHPQLGSQIAKHLEIPFIDQSTKSEKRMEEYEKFDGSDNNRLVATFGTAGTGISINRIFRLVMIDVGKNSTAIIQGIGRGLRLDGVVNHIEVVDIYSDTFYSNKHMRERVNLYKKKQYKYTQSKNHILIT